MLCISDVLEYNTSLWKRKIHRPTPPSRVLSYTFKVVLLIAKVFLNEMTSQILNMLWFPFPSTLIAYFSQYLAARHFLLLLYCTDLTLNWIRGYFLWKQILQHWKSWRIDQAVSGKLLEKPRKFWKTLGELLKFYCKIWVVAMFSILAQAV